MAELRRTKGAEAKNDPKGAAQAGPVPAGAGKLGAPLAEAGVDAKLARRFGKDLRGAVGGLAKLFAAGKGLEAWQSKSFERVLGHSHKVLGALLSALPAEHRAEAATVTTEAWAKLAERPGLGSKLPFALSSAAGLVDSAVRMESRRKLDLAPKDLATLAKASTDQVVALLDAAAGRDGLVTMLNVLPRLVEELELNAQGLDAEARAALVEDVRILVQDTLPRSGATLGDAADLARAVSVAARRNPGETTKVLDLAKRDFLAGRAEALAAAEAKVGAAPDAKLTAVYDALHAVLKANPAGPESLFEATTQAQAVFAKIHKTAGGIPERLRALDALARFLVGAKATPSAEGALRMLARFGPKIIARPQLAGPLAEAAKDGAGDAIAKGVLTAMHGLFPRAQGTPWNEAMKFLDDLAPGEAAQVAFAHAEVADTVQADGDLVWALSQRVQSADSSAAELVGFARRWASVAPHVPAGPQRGAMVAAIVGNARGEAVDANRVRTAINQLQQITAHMPQADAAALVGPGPNGEPGMWALTEPEGWASPPTPILHQLLPHTRGAKGDQHELARTAMQVAESAAHIQAGRNVQVPQIVADFGEAVRNPAALKSAVAAQGQVALRAQAAQPSLPAFAKAHEALPIDFVFTAGLRLTPDQMAWAVDTVDKAHGFEYARLLRDCVLGCVQAGRLDLMEGLRTAKSDGKAQRAVIREVAQAYRVGAARQQPFDGYIAGLAAGEDPVARAVADKTKAAFGDVDLVALAGGKIDNPAGLEEIQSLADNVGELFGQYKTEFKSMDADIDMGKLRPVLDGVLTSVLQGTWPKPKYEDEVGQRQMAALSPAQRAIWRQSTIVAAGGAAPAAEPGPALDEAKALAKGLAKKIPEQARLPKGVNFDQASVDALRADLTETVAKLRESDKGTPEHRELSGKAGPLSLSLAVVEVQVALQNLGDEPDPAAMQDLAPLIPSAARALRKLGATGCALAIGDLSHTLEDLRPAAVVPGSGKWAADQDSLTAMIDSHKSGCLSKGDRRRRWGLAGSLSDANTKMLRVFNGENQTYRTFLRVLPAKIGNYEGPVLFIENPVGDRGGTQEDRQLLEKTLLEKARRMGVPAVGGQNQAPDGWKVLRNPQVNLTFDPGHTGLYHSDRLGQQKRQNAQEPWQVQARNVSVCVPPELADKF